MNKTIINKYITLVKNSANVGELYIAGDIEDIQWWDEDVTPKSILSALTDLGDVTGLKMFVNSYGGSVVAGNAIFNILNDYKKMKSIQIETYISTAMSMASGIAMVGDVVKMYENGIFMIHKPSSMSWGNADDMRTTAEVLDIYEQGLVSNYMTRFNGTEDELKQLLADETYMTAQMAKDYGFVDEIIEPLQMVASANALVINDVEFKNKNVVDIYNKQITKNKESEVKKVMEYDKILLENYGVTEEMFNTLSSVSNLLAIIETKHEKNVADAKAEMQATFDKDKADNYVAKADILEGVAIEGEFEVTAESLKAIMQNKEPITVEVEKPETLDKAKAFDKIKADRIKSALESGITCMGAESIDINAWQGALDKMDYDAICKIQNDWDKQAKQNLNAGNRVSEANGKGFFYGHKEGEMPKKENFNV